MKSLVSLIAMTGALGWAVPATAQITSDLQSDPCDGVCRVAETRLPLRVLPRVASNIYAEQDVESEPVEANVTAFRPMYVFARENLLLESGAASGWYQVGPSQSGEPIGWMRAEDVLEWRQALVAAFSHPGPQDDPDRRQPIVMFEDLDALVEVAEADSREGAYLGTLTAIEAGAPVNGVVTVENRRFVDIDEPGNFYLLPILQFEEEVVREGDVRYLQLAAATGGEEASRSETPDEGTLRDVDYLREAALTESDAGAENLKGVDVVFVMDLTSSMGPVVIDTREAILDMTDALSRFAEIDIDLRFGIVGYRDDLDTLSTLEFTARNFTPELLDAEAFREVLETDVQAAEASSDDYSEEVYAGVATALDEAAWRDDTLRLMVLVGDASPHEPDHPQATTDLDAEALRGIMDEDKVYTFVLHLLNDRFEADHERAAQAFQTLAENEGVGEVGYLTATFATEGDVPSTVKPRALELSQQISRAIANLKGDEAVEVVETTLAEANFDTSDVSEEDRQILARNIDAALVQYVGRSAEPPADLVFWAMDRDMADAGREALSVRLLISKNQLDDLVRALRNIETALETEDANYSDFVDDLQAVMTTAMKDQPIDIARTSVLGQSGLFPRWLDSLPYRSPVLTLTPEMIAGQQADDREEFVAAVKSRIELYEAFLADPDQWIALNDGATDGETVMAIRLEDLP